ncbi:hypothetical protein Dsin_012943 [Dipteronia sinensis]|uniref:RNase H type-1 domain-containing protein n=1 Tax=Dipteronia sinensis TaxID=43782 RepID=A0AAE0AJF8_9ROSI|nr:hypothetical protein Dsin_012943 [Dipteronia sinensis]
MTKLVKRGIQVDHWCHLCGNKAEATIYALGRCPALRVVRRSFVKIKELGVSDNMSFLDFMFACKNQLLPEEMEVLCVVMWRTWYQRNTFIHNSSQVNVNDLVHWAESSFDDFRGANANVNVVGVSGRRGQIVHALRPPDQGVYKINSDAAIDVIRNRIGIGAIIRDYRGLVMASCAQLSQVNLSPQIAEALASSSCFR